MRQLFFCWNTLLMNSKKQLKKFIYYFFLFLVCLNIVLPHTINHLIVDNDCHDDQIFPHDNCKCPCCNTVSYNESFTSTYSFYDTVLKIIFKKDNYTLLHCSGIEHPPKTS